MASTAVLAIFFIPSHAPDQSPSIAFNTTSKMLCIAVKDPAIRLCTLGNTFFATFRRLDAIGFTMSITFENIPVMTGTSFANTCSTCSAIGTTYVCMPLAKLENAFFTLPAAFTNVSKTAVPFSPNVSLIFSRMPSSSPPEKIFFIVFPTFVIAETALSKTSSPFSPNTFPTASRISPKCALSNCTAVITAVIAPTTGRILPAIPASGPSIVEPSLLIGANAVVNSFPIGEIIFPIPLIPDETIFPILPSGDFTITLPTPDRIPPSLPPIAENGFSSVETIFPPTPENAPPSFPAAPENGFRSVAPTSPIAFPTFPK